VTTTPSVTKKPPPIRPPTRARYPTPRPTPTPTATPQALPPVVVALTLTDYTGATRFSVGALTAAGTPRLYCQVRDSALPPNGGTLTYTWTKDTPNGVLFGYTTARAAGAYTTGYYQSPALATPGAYRCDVTVAGQPVGSARLTVAP